MAELTVEELVDGVRSGRRRPIARAISLVENSDAKGYELLKELYPETGRAMRSVSQDRPASANRR